MDLAVDAEAIADSLQLVDRLVDESDCAWQEGAVGGLGVRRLLRFDTVIANLGTVALVIGDPADPLPPLTPADFVFSPCHGHFHFEGFADYSLRDGNGDPVAFGHKQAFCLVDSEIAVPGLPSGGYDCEFQGISPGWADVYDRDLDGQWVDVTGVPPGTYTLVVVVDAADAVDEGLDLQPNVAEVEVVIPP